MLFWLVALLFLLFLPAVVIRSGSHIAVFVFMWRGSYGAVAAEALQYRVKVMKINKLQFF